MVTGAEPEGGEFPLPSVWLCLESLGIGFPWQQALKESKGLGSIGKGICWCLLAASTQTSRLHGMESVAEELVGVILHSKLEISSYV